MFENDKKAQKTGFSAYWSWYFLVIFIEIWTFYTLSFRSARELDRVPIGPFQRNII